MSGAILVDVDGDIRLRTEQDVKNLFLNRVLLGVSEHAKAMKSAMRADVATAALGTRVANAWRSKVYTEGADGERGAVTSYVWTKAPKLIASFYYGLVIRPKGAGGKRFLAIPTENAPKSATTRVINSSVRRQSRTNLLGGTFRPYGTLTAPVAWNTQKYGELKLVKTKRGKLLLVTEDIRSSKRRLLNAKEGPQIARGFGPASVVMFVLVPMVKMPKRLSTGAVADQVSAKYQDKIGTEVFGSSGTLTTGRRR